MNSVTFGALKSFLQLISSIIAIILNSVLIYLIVTKSPAKMGTYRHLMCYFCVSSIIFAVLDVAVKPNIYSRGSAFFMVMDLRNRHLVRWIANLLTCTLCGCCGVVVHEIAVHFIYRFFALERQGRLRYFKGAYLTIWFFIPIIGGASWTFVCWYFFAESPESSEYIGPIILDVFNYRIEDVIYTAAIFWPPNSEGVLEFNWKSGIGLIILFSSLLISFCVVIVAGTKSWRKIRELLEQGESKYSRNLQMQLYKALVAQTVIPVLLIFIPFGVLFLCPLLLVDCEFLSDPLTIIYAVYPALDPLPIILFVDNYRNAIGGLCCQKNRVHNSSGGEGADEEMSRNQTTL